MKKLRVAVLGILSHPICKNALGGTEKFTYYLLEGLVKHNHSVTLFASGDSKTSAKLIPVCSHSIADRMNKINDIKSCKQNVREEVVNYIDEIKKLSEIESQFDIIHDNTLSFVPTLLSSYLKIPVVTTLHLPTNQPYVTLAQNKEHKNPNHYNIAISKLQKDVNHDLKYFDLVYNGLDIDEFLFSKYEKGYATWIGRIEPRKGIREAIIVAIESKVKFVFGGLIGDKDYFNKEIKPLIDNINVVFLGETVGKEKNDLIKNARYFVAPILWEEPFPYVVLESMACGTPIIGFARGSFPESIIDGQTGLLINPSNKDIRGNWVIKETGLVGIKKAINRINIMEKSEYLKMRQNCRQRVENYFSLDTMIDKYVNVYNKVLKNK